MADERTGVARDPGIVVAVKGLGCSRWLKPLLSGLATTIVGVARTRLLCCRVTFPNRPLLSSRIRLYANAIIDGCSNPLLGAEVAFGRLRRNVPQEKLDLLQLSSRCVVEPSTGPSQIVRRQLRHSNALRGFFHDVALSQFYPSGAASSVEHCDLSHSYVRVR
jgi:hypothetical protein